jgi:hypothetical protein
MRYSPLTISSQHESALVSDFGQNARSPRRPEPAGGHLRMNALATIDFQVHQTALPQSNTLDRTVKPSRGL